MKTYNIPQNLVNMLEFVDKDKANELINTFRLIDKQQWTMKSLINNLLGDVEESLTILLNAKLIFTWTYYGEESYTVHTNCGNYIEYTAEEN